MVFTVAKCSIKSRLLQILNRISISFTTVKTACGKKLLKCCPAVRVGGLSRFKPGLGTRALGRCSEPRRPPTRPKHGTRAMHSALRNVWHQKLVNPDHVVRLSRIRQVSREQRHLDDRTLAHPHHHHLPLTGLRACPPRIRYRHPSPRIEGAKIHRKHQLGKPMICGTPGGWPRVAKDSPDPLRRGTIIADHQNRHPVLPAQPQFQTHS